MAWVSIPYSIWQYNDTPTEPPTGNLGQHWLWTLQTDGIRAVSGDNSYYQEIYTQCRLTSLSASSLSGDGYSQGELNKTHWDAVAALGGNPFPWS